MYKWLLLWMPLTLLAGESEAPVAGIVEGVVTNGVTGAPIAGARVSLEATEAELARVASAEANARAELAQVRARAEELFGDLGRAEAAIVEANGRIEAITSTRGYRWSSATVSFLGRLAPPWRRARPGPAAG